MSAITIAMNNEKNGIEIRFGGKPADSVLQMLKSNGFRWSVRQKMWYAKQSQATVDIANSLADGDGVSLEPNNKTNKPENYDLWGMTRTDTIGSNVDKSLDTKQISLLVRKHIKPRFPMFRFSVTSDHNSISIDIKSSPFSKDSEEFKAVKEYVEAYAFSYKYCVHYDPYGDYGSDYNFFGGYCRTAWDYVQTDMTVSCSNMIETFQAKKAAFEQAEALRLQREYEEHVKEMKVEEEKAAERRMAEEAKRNMIEAGVQVFDGKDCYIKNLRDPGISKLNSSKEYEKIVSESGSDDCRYCVCHVTRDVHMTAEQFEVFDNMLLHNWSFIEKTGGSATLDNRVNSEIDFQMMSKEERETVEWYGDNCVAIWCESQLKYVVDAQGFDYCRYVYFPTENTVISHDYSIDQLVSDEQAEQFGFEAEELIDISSKVIYENDLIRAWDNERAEDYIREMKRYIYDHNIAFDVNVVRAISAEYESVKTMMYKLLTVINGIQEQFSRASFLMGQKITIVKMSDFGGLSVQRAVFESVTNCKYAQYDNAVKLVMRPERKRNLYYIYLHGDVMIYDGWLPDLPDSVMFDVISSDHGIVCKKSKYLSCDKRYYDLAYDYYKTLGAIPMVNTNKPELRKGV